MPSSHSHFRSHIARKRFGQNFLQDPTILSRIAGSIPTRQPDETWLEIGPGQGALTAYLLARPDSPHPLSVVEIDRDLVQGLTAQFGPDLLIHSQDILKFDIRSLGAPVRVIGNLPYNLSTPILFHLMSFQHEIRSIHVMLQKEVVDRITGVVGTKDYGRLTVMLQHDFDAVRDPIPIPPSAFDPAPQVGSAWVNLYPRDPEALRSDHPKLFREVVQAAFSLRRKTLKNALENHFAVLKNHPLAWPADLNPSRRAETLSLSEFITLTAHLNKLLSTK